MKTHIIAAVVPLILISRVSSAQDTHEYKNNIISMHIIAPFRSIFQMDYERILHKGTYGLHVGLQVIYKEERWGYHKGGLGSEVQYRLYLNEVNKNKYDLYARLYFAPFFQYQYVEITETHTYYYDPYYYPSPIEHTSYVNSVFGGGNWGLSIFTAKINFDLYVGAGVRYSDVRGYPLGKGSLLDHHYSGVAPRIGMSVGVLF